MKPRDGGSVARKVFINIPCLVFTLSGHTYCINPSTSLILSTTGLHADSCARVYLIPYGFYMERLKI